MIATDEALILEAAVLRMAKPPHRTINAFRHWFDKKLHHNEEMDAILIDSNADKLNDEADLLALCPPVSTTC
jgi:hypothetical protein